MKTIIGLAFLAASVSAFAEGERAPMTHSKYFFCKSSDKAVVFVPDPNYPKYSKILEIYGAHFENVELGDWLAVDHLRCEKRGEILDCPMLEGELGGVERVTQRRLTFNPARSSMKISFNYLVGLTQRRFRGEFQGCVGFNNCAALDKHFKNVSPENYKERLKFGDPAFQCNPRRR